MHETVIFYSIYRTKTSSATCRFHVTLFKNLHHVRNVKDARVANVCMQANAFLKLACDVDQNGQGARQTEGGDESQTDEKKGEKKKRGSFDGARLGVCVSEGWQRVGKSN